jgi:hypothetical protein
VTFATRRVAFSPGLRVVSAFVLVLDTSVTGAQTAVVKACLDAFGDHPFSANPEYRSLSTGVTVFGIGQDTVDDRPTKDPEFVYVTTSVNVMGGNEINLLNPNGWYCMRSNVNVMGGVTIKLACDTKFVLIGDGATVLSNSDTESKGTTVMGATHIERICTDDTAG